MNEWERKRKGNMRDIEKETEVSGGWMNERDGEMKNINGRKACS